MWQLQERIDYQILEVRRVNSIFLSENKYVLAFWYYMKWEYSNLSGKSYLDQTPNSCTSLRGNVWQLQERIDYQILEVRRVNSIFLSENKYVLAFWYYMILNINRDRRLIVEESKLDEKLSRKKIIVSHDSKEIVSNYPPKWMWNFTKPQNKVIIHNFRQHWGE